MARASGSVLDGILGIEDLEVRAFEFDDIGGRIHFDPDAGLVK